MKPDQNAARLSHLEEAAQTLTALVKTAHHNRDFFFAHLVEMARIEGNRLLREANDA